MDEAHIDQVWPHPHPPPMCLATPLLSGHKVLVLEAPMTPKAATPASVAHLPCTELCLLMSWWETLTASLAAGQLVIWNLRLRLSFLCSLQGWKQGKLP